MFREFVLLCRQLDLFGRELLAVDGTRIKAVNSKDRNFTRAALAKIIGDADERLSKYMGHLDKGDADETAADGGDVGRDNKLAEKIAAIRGRRERHKSAARRSRPDRRGPDLADRSGRPGHGAHDQSRRGL